MAKAWMEEKGTWLFDLAHGDLDEDAVVKGFLKHYALQGAGMADVQRELHFGTAYGDYYISGAMDTLRRALEMQVAAPCSECCPGGMVRGNIHAGKNT